MVVFLDLAMDHLRFARYFAGLSEMAEMRVATLYFPFIFRGLMVPGEAP
jgi:hypothetical protein